MSKRKVKILAGSTGALLLACLAGLAVTGWQIGWGPFRILFKGYGGEASAIVKKYDAAERRHEIIFYGASNFRLWTDMEEDLAEYKVQNHGFGGSTDRMLVEYAETLLYPYEPDIVFFQTGSNDYVGLSGTDAEKVSACMEYKKQMFSQFHARLPEAKFVVMSGLLLPGRSEYTALTQQINKALEQLCAGADYLYFVDASAMTYDGGQYADDLFQKDGIHLNRGGQRLWCENYIRPQLEALAGTGDMAHLRREERG